MYNITDSSDILFSYLNSWLKNSQFSPFTKSCSNNDLFTNIDINSWNKLIPIFLAFSLFSRPAPFIHQYSGWKQTSKVKNIVFSRFSFIEMLTLWKQTHQRHVTEYTFPHSVCFRPTPIFVNTCANWFGLKPLNAAEFIFFSSLYISAADKCKYSSSGKAIQRQAVLPLLFSFRSFSARSFLLLQKQSLFSFLFSIPSSTQSVTFSIIFRCYLNVFVCQIYNRPIAVCKPLASLSLTNCIYEIKPLLLG